MPAARDCDRRASRLPRRGCGAVSAKSESGTSDAIRCSRRHANHLDVPSGTRSVEARNVMRTWITISAMTTAALLCATAVHAETRYKGLSVGLLLGQTQA